MPIKITNVSQDPAFAMKRRMASRLQMEPVIAGERLRLRQSRILTDEQVNANVAWLKECENAGVISIEMAGMPLDVLLPTPTPPPPPAPEPTPEPPKSEPEPEAIALPPPPPPAPPAPPESVPLASSSETPSTAATTQPLPNMGHRKGDKKQGR